jgi:SAM-dependent methyltransferase
VNPVVRAAKEARLSYLATGQGLLGRLVTLGLPPQRDESVVPQGVAKDARILEVGCGNGYYLLALFELGYRTLWGIDPFMDQRAVRTSPVRLESRSILDVDPVEGPVDAVLFNHSFEHIAEQHETIERARQLLCSGGVCVIRIPTVSSWAWDHYRCDWVQLDAPRHLYLHSRDSLALLAAQHGFAVERVVDDSTAFQFWGSEKYRQGLSLASSKTSRFKRGGNDFTPEQMGEFESRAADLNSQGRGDQFAAYLRKVDG